MAVLVMTAELTAYPGEKEFKNQNHNVQRKDQLPYRLLIAMNGL